MSNNWKLYLLICPVDNCVRYVGISKNLQQRFNSHLRSSNRENKHKANWIQKLKIKNLKPILKEVYNNLSKTQAEKMEIDLIAIYRQLVNNKLTNISDGGNVPPVISGNSHWTKRPGSSERLSRMVKNYYSNPENRRKLSLKLKGKPKRYTVKMSEAAKQRFSNPQERIKISKIRKEKGLSKGKNNPMFGVARPEVGKRNKEIKSKPVAKLFNGNIIERYSSQTEAAIRNGLDRGNIGKCCRNHTKTCGGYQWRFLSNE